MIHYCTACPAAISDGKEVLIDKKPYHTLCANRLRPHRSILIVAPSNNHWSEELQAVIQVSKRVAEDRIKP